MFIIKYSSHCIAHGSLSHRSREGLEPLFGKNTIDIKCFRVNLKFWVSNVAIIGEALSCITDGREMCCFDGNHTKGQM